MKEDYVWSLSFSVALLAFIAYASAETITSTHNTLMCASPDVLARLILPGGQSRIGTSLEASGDRQAALSGGCIDVSSGTQVEVQSTRTSTSVVTYDAKDGHGPRTFVAPNINFSRASLAVLNSCIRFELKSADITITGFVQPRQHLETRPGGNPDNPQDVAMSHFLVLVMDKPLCAQITGGSGTAVPPVTLKEIDVEGDGVNAVAVLRPWTGKRVTVAGHLSWRGMGWEAVTDPYLVMTKSQVQAAVP